MHAAWQSAAESTILVEPTPGTVQRLLEDGADRLDDIVGGAVVVGGSVVVGAKVVVSAGGVAVAGTTLQSGFT